MHLIYFGVTIVASNSRLFWCELARFGLQCTHTETTVILCIITDNTLPTNYHHPLYQPNSPNELFMNTHIIVIVVAITVTDRRAHWLLAI